MKVKQTHPFESWQCLWQNIRYMNSFIQSYRAVTLATCLLVSAFLSLSGCDVFHQSASGNAHPSLHSEIRTELFCGLSRPNGADVTEEEFAKFLRDEVTPRFPAGFTLVRSQGQWRQREGIIRTEPSRILIIIHPSDQESEKKIEQIRTAYQTQFGQEAVLRTDTREKVSF